MAKVVVLHSGGLDSTVLLAQMVAMHGSDQVESLGVHYGQVHAKEMESALEVCGILDVRRTMVVMSMAHDFFGDCALTGRDSSAIPDGHYSDDTMRSTVVPFRNTILLALCAARATAIKAEVIAMAVHAGDHAIYPDCRPEFLSAMDRVLMCGDYKPLLLDTPFLNYTKAQIVEVGVKCRAPMGFTWSCYKGGHVHCGTCGTCVERREAFIKAGVADPTEYFQTPPIPLRP